MKQVLSLLFVLILTSRVHAQEARLETAVAKLNNAATIGDYQQLANEFTRLSAASPGEWLPIYYAAVSNMKLAFLQKGNPERAMLFSNQAEDQIKKAEEIAKPANNQKDLSEIYCVYSFVNRSRVEADPVTNGRKYGPVAAEQLAKARKLDAANPRALYLDGLIKFQTPPMWGGDKKKAKELFEAAIKQFAQPPASAIAPQWGKKDCEAMLK